MIHDQPFFMAIGLLLVLLHLEKKSYLSLIFTKANETLTNYCWLTLTYEL